MESYNYEKIKEIEKQILKVYIIETPGIIMIGLGLYAKFGARGNAFLPILNDPSFVKFLFIVGTALVVWGSYKFITLSMRKKKLLDAEVELDYRDDP